MAPEGLLPPYNEPTGPLLDDQELLRAYARGDRTGFSEQFHIEGPTLMIGRTFPLATRLSRDTVLVRLDLPERWVAVRAQVEEALGEAGMTLLDHDNMLAVAVALQSLGLRLSSWDLWGRDLDQGFADLRAAAAGDESEAFLSGGSADTPGPFA